MKDGKRDGKGISYFGNGNKSYDGEWKDNMWNGKGTLYYYSGDKLYDGEWKDGKRDGKGIEYFDSGNKSTLVNGKIISEREKELSIIIMEIKTMMENGKMI